MAYIMCWKCTECRLKQEMCLGQELWLIIGWAPDRLSIGVCGLCDQEFLGTKNKRQSIKGWGVKFVCTATSDLHIEFKESYSRDSFLGLEEVHEH
jgi:hypothetical protein